MKIKLPKEAKYICPHCKEAHGKGYKPDVMVKKDARRHYQFRYNYPHGRGSKGRMTVIHRVCGCENAYCEGILGGKVKP